MFRHEEAMTASFTEVLEQAVASQDSAALRHAAQKFEGFFIQMMFKEMRKSVPTGQGFMQPSNAELIFRDMLDEEHAKSAAAAGGIGLADMIYNQLSLNSGQSIDFTL
jgi:flagellar protein FlgJ